MESRRRTILAGAVVLFTVGVVTAMQRGWAAPTPAVLLQARALPVGGLLDQSLSAVALDLQEAEADADAVRAAAAADGDNDELSVPDGESKLWWGHRRRKEKRQAPGEMDENNDKLSVEEYQPIYAPLQENAGLTESEREERVWGPWTHGYSTYWGVPRGIGYANAARQSALLREHQNW